MTKKQKPSRAQFCNNHLLLSATAAAAFGHEARALDDENDANELQQLQS